MPQRVLIVGGHGKVAQLLTPLLLEKAFSVTSMIRHQDQVPDMKKLGLSFPGKLDVLVHSVDGVDTEGKARDILDSVKPDMVAWLAGAGGTGGAERTLKIDRDAAVAFMEASARMQSVCRFLLISYNGSRRQGASWWDPSAWDDYFEKVNEGTLADYYKAKIAADEAFYKIGHESTTMSAICLRPGTLNDTKANGADLGKTSTVEGNASRELVAQVAAQILGSDQVGNLWLDLLNGQEDVGQAVARCIRDQVDSFEGEPITMTI